MLKQVLVITQINNDQILGSSTTELVSFGILKDFDFWVADPSNLSKKTGKPIEAFCQKVVSATIASEITRHCCCFGKLETRNIENFDIILMRVQPPMDCSYFAICSMLSELPKYILIINDPLGIMNIHEKIIPLSFPSIHPVTLISKNLNQMMSFVEKNNFAILKPLYNYQGNDVIKVSLENAENSIKKLLFQYNTPLIIQKFIPEVSMGDKRVYLLDGKPIAAINRIPQNGSYIANLHAGSKAEPIKITERDIEIAQIITPMLQKNGLIFVGLDIINGFLTEISTTSPTGMVQHRLMSGWSIAERFWDRIIEIIKNEIYTN